MKLPLPPDLTATKKNRNRYTALERRIADLYAQVADIKQRIPRLIAAANPEDDDNVREVTNLRTKLEIHEHHIPRLEEGLAELDRELVLEASKHRQPVHEAVTAFLAAEYAALDAAVAPFVPDDNERRRWVDALAQLTPRFAATSEARNFGAALTGKDGAADADFALGCIERLSKLINTAA